MKSIITFTSVEEWEKTFFPDWVVKTEGNKLLQNPHAYAENSIAELTQAMLVTHSIKASSSRRHHKPSIKA